MSACDNPFPDDDRDTKILLFVVQVVLLRDPLAVIEAAWGLLKGVRRAFDFVRDGGLRDLRMNSMRAI